MNWIIQYVFPMYNEQKCCFSGALSLCLHEPATHTCGVGANGSHTPLWRTLPLQSLSFNF
ncbi:hypothetical protein SAMN05444420_10839 [Capnocytophaga granulosa]|uniref:Uncharacterized protein n=1 Tax=Capnocytophaga granulosa TaxID=45242 RepID=A0A1H2YXI4_9FLAO|nr:hypothetical protein [Capnocytophaga granulosa]SDX09269.1 hypothetical protein SAMN05444420_10839 [Capnocytophaga granulosa]SUX14943.1 Uncharacterised protein [Capnocytophaga granulosa]